jgi:hypothetical protein
MSAFQFIKKTSIFTASTLLGFTTYMYFYDEYIFNSKYKVRRCLMEYYQNKENLPQDIQSLIIQNKKHK